MQDYVQMKDVVTNTVGGLDETLVLIDTGSYITTTVVQADGKLTSTGSSVTFDFAKIYAELDSTTGTVNAEENGTSYGTMSLTITDGKISSSSMTINRTNILAEASATVDSGANEYIQVHVTEENHKVTGVTVEFDPWEVYTPSQP